MFRPAPNVPGSRYAQSLLAELNCAVNETIGGAISGPTSGFTPGAHAIVAKHPTGSAGIRGLLGPVARPSRATLSPAPAMRGADVPGARTRATIVFVWPSAPTLGQDHYDLERRRFDNHDPTIGQHEVEVAFVTGNDLYDPGRQRSQLDLCSRNDDPD